MKYTQIFRKTIIEKKAGTYYELFYRILSTPVIWVALRVGLSPNFISFLSGILGLVSFWLYLLYSPITIILFNITVILDHADGPISRFSHTATKKGALLDCMVDKICLYALLVGVSFGAYLRYKEPIILIIGFILLVIREFKLYSNFFIQKIFNYSELDSERKKIRGGSFLFIAASIFIDFIYLLFPFIILFPLHIIIIYFLASILIESMKMFWEIYLALK